MSEMNNLSGTNVTVFLNRYHEGTTFPDKIEGSVLECNPTFIAIWGTELILIPWSNIQKVLVSTPDGE